MSNILICCLDNRLYRLIHHCSELVIACLETTDTRGNFLVLLLDNAIVFTFDRAYFQKHYKLQMMQLKNLAQVAKRNVQATTNPLTLHQVCYCMYHEIRRFFLILYMRLT